MLNNTLRNVIECKCDLSFNLKDVKLENVSEDIQLNSQVSAELDTIKQKDGKEEEEEEEKEYDPWTVDIIEDDSKPWKGKIALHLLWFVYMLWWDVIVLTQLTLCTSSPHQTVA